MRLLSAVSVLLCPLLLPASAQFRAPVPYSLAARTHGNVELGWYASSDLYEYIADVNVAFDFGSWGDARFNIGGGILTLIKNTDAESFQPDRYRGTIEPAAYIQKGSDIYLLTVRHQSFHTIDRPPPLEESYELYSLGYQHLGPTNIRAVVGRYLNRQDVDYQWDAFLEISNACLGTCRYGRIYGSVTGHYVDEDESLSDRGSFFNFSLEAGVQTPVGVRYFVAYRRIHDIDQFNGVADDGILIGVKYLW